MPALEQFLGSAAGLSPATATRLTKQWGEDHAVFQARDLSDSDFVYVWAEGVHLKVRLGQAHSGVLVLLGSPRRNDGADRAGGGSGVDGVMDGPAAGRSRLRVLETWALLFMNRVRGRIREVTAGSGPAPGPS